MATLRMFAHFLFADQLMRFSGSLSSAAFHPTVIAGCGSYRTARPFVSPELKDDARLAADLLHFPPGKDLVVTSVCSGCFAATERRIEVYLGASAHCPSLGGRDMLYWQIWILKSRIMALMAKKSECELVG